MTREEAIKYLKEMKDECNDTIHKVRYVTQEEALEMAIKALEQDYICDTCKHKEDSWDTEPCDSCCGNHSGYEPSGDTVSLEAFKQVMWERNIAIEQLHELGYGLGQKINPNCPYYVIDDDGHGLCKNHRVLEQEPKTGHWINDEDTIGVYYCSKCGGYVASYDDAYCKYCGARMVEQERSEKE